MIKAMTKTPPLLDDHIGDKTVALSCSYGVDNFVFLKV
jgi:hypothetical protein